MIPGRLSALALLLAGACALACGGAPVGDVVADVPTAPVVADVPVPPPVVAPDAPSDEPPGPHAAPKSREEVVAAYLADCAVVFRADVEDSDYDNADECSWREFDQNCSADPSGCWGSGQECLDGCGTTCGECQAACAGACGTCKSACGTDAACLSTCAESRADCRDVCVGARATCMDSTCPEASARCDAAWEVKKAATCPQCAEMLTCSEEAFRAQDYQFAVCRERFASAPPECFDWCSVSWQ